MEQSKVESIEITDQDIVQAVYECRIFERAMPYVKEMMSIDDAIELVQKHMSLLYAAWFKITEKYPRVREDIKNGINWSWQLTPFNLRIFRG